MHDARRSTRGPAKQNPHSLAIRSLSCAPCPAWCRSGINCDCNYFNQNYWHQTKWKTELQLRTTSALWWIHFHLSLPSPRTIGPIGRWRYSSGMWMRTEAFPLYFSKLYIVCCFLVCDKYDSFSKQKKTVIMLHIRRRCRCRWRCSWCVFQIINYCCCCCSCCYLSNICLCLITTELIEGPASQHRREKCTVFCDLVEPFRTSPSIPSLRERQCS